MHPEAYAFVEKSVADLAIDIKTQHVIELGSYNINGSIRPVFAAAASYIGVDRRSGPGVDVIARAQEFTPERLGDVVVSTETIEHDPDPEGLIAAAFRCLCPGGTFILTGAAPERTPHGNDGGAVRSGEHYANIDPSDLRRWLKASGFVETKVTHNRDVGDLYAIATKPKANANEAKADAKKE